MKNRPAHRRPIAAATFFGGLAFCCVAALPVGADETLSPAALMKRATRFDQVFRSFLVYPTTVGFPVVPDDEWMRTTSLSGTANIP